MAAAWKRRDMMREQGKRLDMKKSRSYNSRNIRCSTKKGPAWGEHAIWEGREGGVT
jgi:hypothetical protein